ncbi:hypothetical protein OIU74_001162 [Salix koriyanagi]|uniref:PGG domain-containing protein n=1 Tax=Salix koriyanagi TaxID=2511006 RepID=A0A9Q0X0T6_9ROSI|nr:hypothetical protein OIU74_001162 [Salix koriyanagi]
MATDPFNITSEARNSLLVVATLIVAVTFQAAINPPGGVWQEDRYKPSNCTEVTSDCIRVARAGRSVLYSQSKIRYGIFIFINTMAFSAATSTIRFLLQGSPFQTETLISVYGMNFAYAAAAGSVQPQTVETWVMLVVALSLPYIFRLPYIIKWRKLAREQDVSQGPPCLSACCLLRNYLKSWSS